LGDAGGHPAFLARTFLARTFLALWASGV